MQSHIDKLDKDLEAFRVVSTFARDIAGYLSEDCILAISQGSIVVYSATRADLKLIMSLKRGGAWNKSNPGDGDVRYSTWVTLSTGDVLLSVDCSELPPSCRVEWEEVAVPASVKRVAKVVCR